MTIVSVLVLDERQERAAEAVRDDALVVAPDDLVDEVHALLASGVTETFLNHVRRKFVLNNTQHNTTQQTRQHTTQRETNEPTTDNTKIEQECSAVDIGRGNEMNEIKPKQLTQCDPSSAVASCAAN